MIVFRLSERKEHTSLNRRICLLMKYNFDFLNIFTNEDIEINLDEPMNKHTSFKIAEKPMYTAKLRQKKPLRNLSVYVRKMKFHISL